MKNNIRLRRVVVWMLFLTIGGCSEQSGTDPGMDAAVADGGMGMDAALSDGATDSSPGDGATADVDADPGDTDAGDVSVPDAGDASVPDAPSPFATPVTLPVCDPANPEVHFIAAEADWGAINDPDKRIFCVQAGDYTAVGRIVLSARGTASAKRYLISVESAGGTSPREMHPVHLSDAQRATVVGIGFQSAEHWVVDGLTVRREDRGAMIRFDETSSENLLNRLLVSGAGGGGGQISFRNSSHNAIQYSVVRETLLQPGGDFHCITLGAATGTRIVSNEIYDCAGDSIQIHPTGGEGTIIADNDLYITPALYSDCAGGLDPTGDCACAENALDIKSVFFAPPTSVSEASWVKVIGNRMWGFRRTDTGCGGTGSGGPAMVIHIEETSDFILIEDNLLFDLPYGINMAGVTDHISIVHNVLYNIHGNVGVDVRGGRHELYFNVFVDLDNYVRFSAEQSDLRCNVMIDAGAARGDPDPSATADENAYYNSTPVGVSEATRLVFPTADASLNTTLCVRTKRLTEAANEVCVPHGATSDSSPHSTLCAAGAGNLPSVGVDDRVWDMGWP